MGSFIAAVGEQLGAWSAPEATAVVFAILYLLLAIRESIWCWYCAGISTIIYVVLFADARLYMESLLNVFYFAMAIYGWWVWRRGHTPDGDLDVVSWPARLHAAAVAIILALVLATGSLLSRYTDAAYPFIDSATTYAAVWATFLVARKVLENWWYWLLIDAVSVVIYWSRGLELTSLLFVLYVVMIPFGLVSWGRSYRQAAASAVPATP
jgi:nicotinamide mononucleotide transporter